jgi:diacylglycerol kinase family enzyme
VQLRERYRRSGLAKWAVATWATLRVTRNAKAQRVELTIDGRRREHTTPLVFIGNNKYKMEGFDAGSRAVLTDGALAIYVVEADRRWGLLRLVWRILTGTARSSGELVELNGRVVLVDGPGDTAGISVPVAVDGEVSALKLPLRYQTRPLALAVCVP